MKSKIAIVLLIVLALAPLASAEILRVIGNPYQKANFVTGAAEVEYPSGGSDTIEGGAGMDTLTPTVQYPTSTGTPTYSSLPPEYQLLVQAVVAGVMQGLTPLIEAIQQANQLVQYHMDYTHIQNRYDMPGPMGAPTYPDYQQAYQSGGARTLRPASTSGVAGAGIGASAYPSTQMPYQGPGASAISAPSALSGSESSVEPGSTASSDKCCYGGYVAGGNIACTSISLGRCEMSGCYISDC